jgi:hypothetical protein
VTTIPVHAGPAGLIEAQVISDDAMKAKFAVSAGADVLPTTRTVAHWWGSTTNPHDGVTYGYNMVGADPYACVGAACDVTIEVDIVPIVVNVAGRTVDGSNVLQATLESPQFTPVDHGTTPFASTTAFTRGPGGILSQEDNGPALQFQDFASAVAEFGLLLRDSEFKAASSYSDVRERAMRAQGADPFGHRAEFIRLVTAAEALVGLGRGSN